MNEPLRDILVKFRGAQKEPTSIESWNNHEKCIMQLFRTTLTDLQAEMPTEIIVSTPSLMGQQHILGFNQAVQQQQDAFKKVLEGMK